MGFARFSTPAVASAAVARLHGVQVAEAVGYSEYS
jgi:hypothetical protein